MRIALQVSIALTAATVASWAHATLVELTGVAQLDARSAHACVVTTGGAVMCWGENGSGQLGDGSTSSRLGASPVTDLSSGAVAVAVNGAHSCAVMAGGGVKCWGNNSTGQLGDGTTTSRATPADVQGLPWPVAALSLGEIYTCALSSGGAVACWGHNGWGQLGDGTTTQRLAPTPVTGLSSGVTAISASRTYTCAIASGVVKCWGTLINSVIWTVPLPTDVEGLPSGAIAVSTESRSPTMFQVDMARACAVFATTTKCWPTSTDVPGVAPGALAITSAGGRMVVGPLQTTFTWSRSCVVTPGGGAQCWGTNYCGIVGVPTGSACNNMGTGVDTLPPTDVPGLSSGVVSVSASPLTTCALQSAGTVKCWGKGYGPSPVAQMSGIVTDLPRLSNASTRLQVGTGEDVAIGGFVIGSGGDKVVAIVATGPSLSAHGIANPLANPTLRLVRSSDQVTLATNDDWGTAANMADLQAAGFAPTNALESAILVSLPPGAYTAIVEGVGGGTGVAVVGVYEVDAPATPLANLSTRGRVLTGDNVMIGGFVVQGEVPRKVAIVATGPSLSAHGIANPLANPMLSLVRSSDQVVLATNDDWITASNASELLVAGLAPPDTREAAILVTLPPGAYTAIVSGVGGGTGVAVVGVYKVD